MKNRVLEGSVEFSLDGKKTEVGVLEGAKEALLSSKGKVYIETYGCQMNFSDSEIIASILSDKGYDLTDKLTQADVIFLNTCAIRENAENKIRSRLENLAPLKKSNPDLIFGVVGCMAERLKKKIFEEETLVDVIAGPDAYRTLPNLIDLAEKGQKAANVFLSLEETYADITPVRRQGVSAFLSIMRGCDNMCSFCVVPYTRGRERSRPVASILDEVRTLIKDGIKEITLLGQNVNSYVDETEKCSFAQLVKKVSLEDPSVRIRFTTSNPHDITEELIDVIAEMPNVCNYVHLPVQSGSTRILDLMNRKYTRESYLETVKKIKTKIPSVSFSTDIIAGFCTETEADHRDTLDLLREVKFDYAYTFIYSERPNTLAARKYKDDVSFEDKQRRLEEIISLQHSISADLFQGYVGKQVDVLIEGNSKKSNDMWVGRADGNQSVVFPKRQEQVGDTVRVLIHKATSATLIGEPK